MSRIVKCPRCGNSFEVRTRAKMGEGTQREVGINQNRRVLLDLLVNYTAPLAVRDIQNSLYAQRIKRFRRGDKTVATGGWNYHQVQADLSLLVGNGYATMTRTKEGFDTVGFKADPTPKYYMTDTQKISWRARR